MRQTPHRRAVLAAALLQLLLLISRMQPLVRKIPQRPKVDRVAQGPTTNVNEGIGAATDIPLRITIKAESSKHGEVGWRRYRPRLPPVAAAIALTHSPRTTEVLVVQGFSRFQRDPIVIFAASIAILPARCACQRSLGVEREQPLLGCAMAALLVVRTLGVCERDDGLLAPWSR